MNLPENQIGYQISPFTLFPLPRKDVGTVFSRTVNNITVTYSNHLGVLHTALARRWLEILTTKAVKQKANSANPRMVELHSVTQTLKDFGMANNGNYIGSAVKIIKQIAAQSIIVTHRSDPSGKLVKRLPLEQGQLCFLAHKYQLYWGSGNTKTTLPDLFDDQNFFEWSTEAWKYIENATPHDQRHAMQISSSTEYDLYMWLVESLYSLKEKDKLIPWVWFYIQFGQAEGILKPEQMKFIRKQVKTYLTRIKTKYYLNAKFRFTDEGVVLEKSPALIQPDNKHAGFLA